MTGPELPLTGPLSALGIDVLSEQIYRLCLRRPGLSVEGLCDIVGRRIEEPLWDFLSLIERRN